MFRTDEEIQKLNGERMDALAEAIAKKVQPYNPLRFPRARRRPRRCRTSRSTSAPSRLQLKIQPILSEMAKDQNLTRALDREVHPAHR